MTAAADEDARVEEFKLQKQKMKPPKENFADNLGIVDESKKLQQRTEDQFLIEKL